MHVSPPGRIARMADCTAERDAGSTVVGGTSSEAVVSNATTVTRSPSRMRSTAPEAAAMAFRIFSPAIEPERSTTMTRCDEADEPEEAPLTGSDAVTVASRKVEAAVPVVLRGTALCPSRPSSSNVEPSTKCAGVVDDPGSGEMAMGSGTVERARDRGTVAATALASDMPSADQRANVRTSIPSLRARNTKDLPGGLRREAYPRRLQ